MSVSDWVILGLAAVVVANLFLGVAIWHKMKQQDELINRLATFIGEMWEFIERKLGE